MRLKDGFKLVDVVGDFTLIPVGEDATSFGGYVALNAVSAFLIRQMASDITEQELVLRLMEEYEIDEETAKESVDDAIAMLREIGVIHEH